MLTEDQQIILGSRSPRRIELLSYLIPPKQIQVVVPEDEREAGFEGLTSLNEILLRLQQIARTKNDAVATQLSLQALPLILTADTTVIVPLDSGRFTVVGKPDGANWKEVAAGWFRDYYSDRSHFVATGVCLRCRNGEILQTQVCTKVSFLPVTNAQIDWYLKTEEPLGKAGGYGIQGAAGIFVKAIEGSLSNVIGLPLAETKLLLDQAELE
ncbi:Maf family protein [Planctomicrobium sp. SH668]|uniref:Maf family protein n=1 Tax=Planctomicrobium sp. SH668 TaxID=3448126 RepID=UPI003F5B08D9